MSEEHILSFRLEDGHLVVDSEEDLDLLESTFIGWVSDGYMEPKNIREGRLTYRLTPFGKEHINDILKVRGEKQ